MPAACSSRRDAGAEPTASTCAPANGSCSGSEGLGRALSRAHCRAHPAYLRQVGVEVELITPWRPTPCSPDRPRRDRHGRVLVVPLTGSGPAAMVRPRLQRHRYCQRLVTADLNQADRILDEEQRARVLNRVDRRLAKDVPVIPLYQPPAVIAYRATIRNVGSVCLDLRTRRTGGSRSSPRRGIAVSLLAVSGAGGAPAQSPKRGGTLVVAHVSARAAVPQRLVVRAGGSSDPAIIMHLPRGRVRGRPQTLVRPNLVSGSDHDEAALHAHVPHPARGALERGVPLTARISCSPTGLARGSAELDRLGDDLSVPQRACRSTRRRSRSSFDARFSGWRSCSRTSYRDTHSRDRTSRRSG